MKCSTCHSKLRTYILIGLHIELEDIGRINKRVINKKQTHVVNGERPEKTTVYCPKCGVVDLEQSLDQVANDYEMW